MFVSGLPHALRCSCTERIVSLRLRLHHWVMARHRTAGHSPLPPTAPAALAPPRAPGLGQQLSPVFIPLRVTHTAVTPHGRRPTHPSSRRSYTWSELIASSGTSLLHELHYDASRVIAAPTTCTAGSLSAPRSKLKQLTILHMWGQSLQHGSSISTLRTTCWSCRQLSLLTSKSLSWRSPLITPSPTSPGLNRRYRLSTSR